MDQVPKGGERGSLRVGHSALDEMAWDLQRCALLLSLMFSGFLFCAPLEMGGHFKDSMSRSYT